MRSQDRDRSPLPPAAVRGCLYAVCIETGPDFAEIVGGRLQILERLDFARDAAQFVDRLLGFGSIVPETGGRQMVVGQ